MIDAILLIGFCLKDKIMMETSNQKALYLSKDKTTIEKMFNVIQEWALLYLVFVSVYVSVAFWPKVIEYKFINSFFIIYDKIVLGLIFPSVINTVREIIKKGLGLGIWRIIFFIIINIIILLYSNMNPDDTIVIYISAFLSLVIETIGKVIFEYKNAPPKTLGKNIRKDLCYRTTGIDLTTSINEMDRFCERVFNDYIRLYYRLEKLEKIEFICLLENNYGETFYKSVGNKINCLVIIGTLISLIIAFIKYNPLLDIIIGVLILLYAIMICIFKKWKPMCLKRIVLRFFYDEWGYYLVGKKKEKFVGRVQLLDHSLYHKYIHSFWNIVALCRLVAYNDRYNNEADKRIKHLSEELSILFVEYVKSLKEKNWELYLPLWGAALFEYDVTGKVNKETKKVLQTVYKEENKAGINDFMQSFWFYDMGMRAKQESFAYMKKFEKEMCKNIPVKKSRIKTIKGDV